MRRIAPLSLLVVALVLAAPGALRAGPPGICFPVEIGDAESLPTGQAAEGYDRARVVPDTLALLRPDTPVLVRMETIRRAALFLHRDGSRRDALLRALMARVLDAEVSGQPDALAWFDAGYAHGCLEQLGAVERDGYAWIRHALALRDDPAVHYAAVLITILGEGERLDACRAHLAAAEAGRDPLLEKNVAAFRVHGEHLLNRLARANRD